jgi:hypothetical protein
MTTNLTPINPTEISEQLAQALRNYLQSSQELGDYKAKAERAQADQEAALASDEPENEVASKIAKSEALKSVFSVRTKHKESELARLTSELEAAYPPTVLQFGSLLNDEIAKRRALVEARLLEALNADETLLATHETYIIPQHTGALADFAKSVREISSLRPTTYWGTRGDGVAIAAAADSLLKNLQQFKDLTK